MMLKTGDIYKIISECTENSSKNSPKDVQEIFEYFTELIKKQLISEGEIKMPYLGKWKITISSERIYTDPRTNETKKIPPKAKVKFLPNKELKEEIAKIDWEYKKN